MPVLHEVVEELGHVAREDVEAIADVLNLSVAEVHGVVSFYHDFRTEPPAAHTVALCRGEACQSVGAEALYAETRARAGSLGADVEVDEVFCLGNCALGPVRDARRPPARPAVDASGSTRSRRGGVDGTDCRVFVPGDAAAVSVGADEVAAAFEAAGAQRRPQRLARDALARAAGRGRDRRGPGRLRQRRPPTTSPAVLDGRGRPASAWSTSTRGWPRSAG